MVVEIEPDLPHTHCEVCYDRNCHVSPQPGNACSLVNCDVDCGARFHRCKVGEHRLLCPNAKTECVNAIYGCPVDIQRRLICKHLEVCPASVINCTMEWNRWPVYASERQPQQPLQLVPDNLNQLDIALALRDQRMLTKSMKASKRTRQILTNALNRRHPAVPLSAQLTSTEVVDGEEEQRELDNLLQVMQGEKEAADRERARTPPGLQRSICNELYKQTHDSHGSGAAGGDQPFYPLPRDPFIQCSHCVRRKERMERVMASHEAMQPQDIGKETSGVLAMDGWMRSPSFSNSDIAPLHEQHNGFAHDIEPCVIGLHHHDGREDAVFTEGFIEPSPDNVRPASLNSTFSSEDSDIHTPAVFVTQSTTGDVSAAPTRGHSKLIIIQPPALASSGTADKSHRLSSSSNGSLDSRHSLSLDLSLESITRYQAKPDSMYTFLCAQEFRRDEYPYHFQNVHSDIHGGLNGWMEQRCPLAPYGCTYSQRRLYPGSQGARIIHSENLESFGLCLDGEASQDDREVERVAAFPKCAKIQSEDLDSSTRGGAEELVHVCGDEHEKGDGGPREIQPAMNGEVDDSPGENCPSHISNKESDVSLSELNESHTSTDSKCNALHQEETNSGRGKGQNINEIIVSMETEDAKTGVHIGSKCTTEVAKLDQSASESVALTTPHNQDAEPENDAIDSCHRELEDESATVPVEPTPQAPESCGTNVGSSGFDHLSQLPFELLRYLLRFLDSFTINHVATTSKLLRQVCCSLLEERGMVVLQWEKRKGHWDTTMKVWHFSTAFTPVTSWGFEDNPPIAEHLKHCPFNVRNIASSPVKVMGHDTASVKLGSPSESKASEAKAREEETPKPWRPRRRRLMDTDDDW